MNGGSTHIIHRAMRKYGANNFRVELLTQCVSLDEAKTCERAMIASHSTYYRAGSGYNMTIGGEGSIGLKHSEETKRKIRQITTGKKASLEARAKMSSALRLRGPISEETRRKLSESASKFRHSEESKAKMRLRVTSEETRAKMRCSAKNKPPASKETRARISASSKPKTAEHQAKLAASNRSQEHIAKQSDAVKNWWKDPVNKSKQSSRVKLLWQDPVYRDKIKMSKKVHASSIQLANGAGQDNSINQSDLFKETERAS